MPQADESQVYLELTLYALHALRTEGGTVVAGGECVLENKVSLGALLDAVAPGRKTDGLRAVASVWPPFTQWYLSTDTEAMLDRTPVVRGIYKSVKQIFETVFSQSGTQFRKVGLVEFPLKGSWSVVFISSDPAKAVADVLPTGGMTSVFLPCIPNPTTGFYFFVPTKDIIELPMSPDDAAKLIMSAGLIQPAGQAALAAMAQAARQAAPVSAAETL